MGRGKLLGTGRERRDQALPLKHLVLGQLPDQIAKFVPLIVKN